MVDTKTKKMKKQLRNYLPFIILAIVFVLTWLLLFSTELIPEDEQKIAGIISLLGLELGAFQIWLFQANIKKRNLFDLRYETYKEFVSIIDSISETLNIAMTNKKRIEIHGLLSKLMNQINRFNSSININKDFLFPGLSVKPETEKLNNILENILGRTDEFRKNIEDMASSRELKNFLEFLESVEEINWHNNIRDYLDEINKNKYDFYKVLRGYL